MTRLVVDPVTRIGGHLRVETEVADGIVNDAWVSGTMFRGIESILRGRDPRDAWLLAERVCGKCTGVHALASVRAVENALGIAIPRNARLVRNLITGSTYVQDHVSHFYLHELPDWADAISALSADPSATSVFARMLSDWPNSSADHFAAARTKLATLVESGPLANGYWGHPAYRLPPELNLLLFAHYLEALDWQRQLVRLRTILGGKSPHPQTYLVGGMAMAPEWGGPTLPSQGEHPWRAARHSPTPLSANGLSDVGELLSDATRFVTDVFVRDVLAVAAHYPDWEQIGRGIGHYLSLGEFPTDNAQPAPLFLPRGRVMDRDVTAVRQVDQSGVAETVSHSWYEYEAGDDALLHPSMGLTRPRYSGPRLPFTSLEGADGYSWLKAPRYADDPMEVGPVARLLVAYGAGSSTVMSAVDLTVFPLNTGMDALFGTLGRTVARAIEARVVAERMAQWLRELIANLSTGDLAVVDLNAWDTARWPVEAVGFGLVEGPRGAVGHWLKIRNGRIADYQIVDASTWNGSPRDARGRSGACERALLGTPVADPNRPLEILRTVHSFALCPACAVH